MHTFYWLASTETHKIISLSGLTDLLHVSFFFLHFTDTFTKDVFCSSHFSCFLQEIPARYKR